MNEIREIQQVGRLYFVHFVQIRCFIGVNFLFRSFQCKSMIQSVLLPGGSFKHVLSFACVWERCSI